MILRWRSLEPRILLALFAAALGLWAFIEVAEGVRKGDARNLDAAILLALRNPNDHALPIGPRYLAEFGRDLTAFGGVGVLCLLIAATVVFLFLAHRRRTALFVIVAIAGGGGLASLLKSVYDRPRPNLVSNVYVYTSSFPSAHAMMSAIVYLTLGTLIANLLSEWPLKLYVMLVAVILTIMVGISRIYLGVHWPSDVVAGWAAGSAWALICWAVAQYFANRESRRA